jgi:hypothetical protein
VCGPQLLRSSLRTALASAVAGVAGWGAAVWLTPGSAAGGGVGPVLRASGGPVARMLPGFAGVFVFAAVFALVAWGLRAPELDEMTGAIRRRLARRTRKP